MTTLALASLFFAGATNVVAQHWTQLSLPFDSAFVSPYFINKDTGFIFNPQAIFYNLNLSHLNRTVDGGNTWIAIPYFDSAGVAVRQIYFESATKGYIAASNGVYETENTGITWHRIYKDSVTFSSVYAFNGKVYAYGGQFEDILYSDGFGPLITSTNDGYTWDTIIAYKPYHSPGLDVISSIMPYVFGNKDGLVFAENFDSLSTMFLTFSTDNGNSWNSRMMDSATSSIEIILTMGLFPFPHCKNLLRTLFVPGFVNPDKYYIDHSDDAGMNWDSVYYAELGSWITGNNCVQYVSDAYGNQDHPYDRTGLWRSTNHGKNWEYIDGPDVTEIDDWDYPNISVVGGGAVVYVASPRSINTLWKTTDGGDGTLSAAALASNILLRHDITSAATICDTSIVGIYFQNLSCNYSLLKDIKIDGLDSTEFSSEWKHHLACEGNPDSLLIQIFSIPAGPDTYMVHLHFVNDEFYAIDSTIEIDVSPSYVSTNLQIFYNLIAATLVCDTSQFIMTYQNLSCNHTSLKNFTIDGLDSSQFSALLKQHARADGVPDTLLVKILGLSFGSGTYTIHEHFVNDQSEALDTSFTFILSLQSIPVDRFTVHSPSLFRNLNDTIELPLFINKSQNTTGLTSIDLQYSVNTNLLTPLTFIPISGVTADPVQTTRITATVTLHFDPSFTFSGETELGRLRCVAYVTDTLETDIMLTGVTHSSGCLSTLADSNTVHFTLTGCGIPTLSKFIKFGTAYDIMSIVPNPAGNSVQVQLKNNGSPLNYQLFDALGAMQKSGATAGNAVQIDLSGLSSGNYYFRLSGEGGIPVTKSLVIMK
jgi:hypothetical protein